MSIPKKAYTEMHTLTKSAAKSLRLPYDDFCKEWLRQMEQDGEPLNEIFLESEALIVDRAIDHDEAVHLFFPDLEFCNWIVSCVEEFDPIHAEVVSDMVDNGVGCVHFPAKSKLTSFGFFIGQKTIEHNGTPGPDFGQLIFSFSKGNKDDLGRAGVKLTSDAEGRKEVLWYAKLVVGIGMYISAFPEQIKNGVPEDIKNPNHFRIKTSKMIGVSDKIINRDGPSAHYRVGHLRVLRSERYTKKRFSVIFVEGCFVKGRALTVLPI